MIELFTSFFVFSVLLLFLFASFVWVALMLISFGGDKKDFEYSAEDAQVRILTLNNQKVVQKTVDSIPKEMDDIHVIAEEPMDIQGANVHVVSDSFVCNVKRKGRAIEWGRRNIDCEKEFVLYIDEDTIVGDLKGFSDDDIIQFSENPIRSDGLIPYLSDIFRMGFQVEQRSFPSLRYPLYAWGGGFAVKKSLEDKITWDVCTVTEEY